MTLIPTQLWLLGSMCSDYRHHILFSQIHFCINYDIICLLIFPLLLLYLLFVTNTYHTALFLPMLIVSQSDLVHFFCPKHVVVPPSLLSFIQNQFDSIHAHYDIKIELNIQSTLFLSSLTFHLSIKVYF